MTPCEKLGYKVGDEFEYAPPSGNNDLFKKGARLNLFNDDGSDYPALKTIDGSSAYDGSDYAYTSIDDIKPLAITLQPGDYVLTDGMSESDYHAVAAAFMAAGAGSGEYPEWEDYAKGGYFDSFGWLVSDNALYHGDTVLSNEGDLCGGRRLTITQALIATNAKADGLAGECGGPKINTEEPPMHIIDDLDDARHEMRRAQELYDTLRDEAAKRYPWLFDAQPTEDMADPANWKEGDLVECIGSTNEGWKRIKKKVGVVSGRFCGKKPYIDYAGETDWLADSSNCQFKFHSRPAK